MTLERQLTGWTSPSSDSEQEKQERTERMIREALQNHPSFAGCSLSVFAKGSYPNNTNVRIESDVDIAVECREAVYWEEANPGARPVRGGYQGVWTPAHLRRELELALSACFPSQVDISGEIAIRVHSGSARVDADVVPCFTFKRWFSHDSFRQGTKIFKKSGASIVNYPAQQLSKGREKNQRTGGAYKKTVRILKRIQSALPANPARLPLPSYFIECLVFNCNELVFDYPTWTETLRAVLLDLWNHLDSDEPQDASARPVEANGCFYLFRSAQPISRVHARDFVAAAWQYLDF